MTQDRRKHYIDILIADWDFQEKEAGLLFDEYGVREIAGNIRKCDYQREKQGGIRDPKAYFVSALERNRRNYKKDSSSNISEADSYARSDEAYEKQLKAQAERTGG